ncbi:hypothetical protein B4U79_01602, partial [Dinothrombium tinctorium]
MPENKQTKPMFGEFKCDDCHRHWYSASAWKNYGQICSKCGTLKYPLILRPLNESEGLNKINPNKPHLKDLCEKCIKLGHSCKN